MTPHRAQRPPSSGPRGTLRNTHLRDSGQHHCLPHSVGPPAPSPAHGRPLRLAPAIKLAFEFLVLTEARSGEVRLTTWDEIDLAAAEWTVPAERTKANPEHRVPLCDRTVEILNEARSVSGGNRLVVAPQHFHNLRTPQWSDMGCSSAIIDESQHRTPERNLRHTRHQWASRAASAIYRLRRITASPHPNV